MPVLDIFAWIVLLILCASGLAIFFIAGSGPGSIARNRAAGGGNAMIVVLLNVYLVILFLLVKLKIVTFNLF